MPEYNRPASKQPIPPHAKRVFEGIFFDVYHWEQKIYDGRTRTFEKLKRNDTVVVLPVTSKGRIVLTRQEQPGRKSFRGPIGGVVDFGEEPFAAAQRELREEAGMESSDWELWQVMELSSRIEWATYIYVARMAKKTSPQMLDGGERIELFEVDFSGFVQAASDPAFDDFELRMLVLEARLYPEKMRTLESLLGIKPTPIMQEFDPLPRPV